MLVTCVIAFLGVALVAQYQGSCDTGIRGLTDIFFEAETPSGGWRLPGDPEPANRLGLAVAASAKNGAMRVAQRAETALPDTTNAAGRVTGKQKTIIMLAGGEKLRVTPGSFVMDGELAVDPEAAEQAAASRAYPTSSTSVELAVAASAAAGLKRLEYSKMGTTI